MSLRARLTLRFVSIVVLPVTAVTAYGWQAVARSTQRQIRAELQLARNSAAVAFNAPDRAGPRGRGLAGPRPGPAAPFGPAATSWPAP